MQVRIGRHKIFIFQRRKLGQWFAFRDRVPRFCVSDPVKLEAIKKAARAIAYYKQYQSD